MNRLIASLSLMLLALATSAQAMVVQPQSTAVQPVASSDVDSRSAYAFIVDSAVLGENSCRNNPVDLSDPLGLDANSILSWTTPEGEKGAFITSDWLNYELSSLTPAPPPAPPPPKPVPYQPPSIYAAQPRTQKPVGEIRAIPSMAEMNWRMNSLPYRNSSPHETTAWYYQSPPEVRERVDTAETWITLALPIALEGKLAKEAVVLWLERSAAKNIPNASANLGERELVNFTRWQANQTVLFEEDVLYRMHPEGGSGGAWWTRTKPSSELQHRMDAAWRIDWGEADELSTLRIPSGSGLNAWEGSAAYQGDFYFGGGNQLYIPNIPSEWITTAPLR